MKRLLVPVLILLVSLPAVAQEAFSRYIAIEDYTGLSVIKVSTVDDFIDLARRNKVSTAFIKWNSDSVVSTVLVKVDSVFYSFELSGYSTVADYLKGTRTGYPDGAAYYEAVKLGITQLDFYKYYKRNAFAAVEDARKAFASGFVLDDMTSEIQLSPRGVFDYDRWAWQKNYKDPRRVDMFPIMIHKERQFSRDWVEYPYVLNPDTLKIEPDKRGFQPFPQDHWRKYWEDRKEYTAISQSSVKEAFKELTKDPPNGDEIGSSALKNKGITNETLRSWAAKCMRRHNPAEDTSLLEELMTFTRQ